MTTATTGLANVVMSLQPDGDSAFLEQWRQDVVGAARALPGFLESEVFTPLPGIQDRWVLLLRFKAPADLGVWLASEARRALMEKASALAPQQQVVAGMGSMERPVSLVVSTTVQPDRVEAFKAWQAEISARQKTFPGFMDYQLIAPVEGVSDNWTIVVRFTSDESLEAWMSSEERQRLMDKIDPPLRGEIKKVVTDFGGWFSVASDQGVAPPNWKQALSVLLGIYPTVMLVFLFLLPRLQAAGAPAALCVFCDNCTSVTVLTWIVMPILTRILDFWFNPRKGAPRWVDAAGTAAVVAAILTMLATFLWLTRK